MIVFDNNFKNHRLDVLPPYDVVQSKDAELYNDASRIINPYMQSLFKKAFSKEEIGDYKHSNEYFVAANYFTYIVNYLFIIYRYKDRALQNPYNNVTGTDIAVKFKIDCVYSGIGCLGCGESLQQAFKDIVRTFGLQDVFTRVTDDRECVGLGRMIISGAEDNTAFFVGDNCYIQDINPTANGSSFDTPSFDTKSLN